MNRHGRALPDDRDFRSGDIATRGLKDNGTLSRTGIVVVGYSLLSTMSTVMSGKKMCFSPVRLQGIIVTIKTIS
jgi:hypothetical protein